MLNISKAADGPALIRDMLNCRIPRQLAPMVTDEEGNIIPLDEWTDEMRDLVITQVRKNFKWALEQLVKMMPHSIADSIRRK